MRLPCRERVISQSLPWHRRASDHLYLPNSVARVQPAATLLRTACRAPAFCATVTSELKRRKVVAKSTSTASRTFRPLDRRQRFEVSRDRGAVLLRQF